MNKEGSNEKNVVQLMSNQETDRSNSEMQNCVNTFQSILHDQIFNLFESLSIDKKTVQQFNKNMISVNIGDNGKPFASVECILCIVENLKCKKNAISVRCKLRGRKHYWIISNFKKHIQKHIQLNEYADSEADRRTDLRSVQSIEILTAAESNYEIQLVSESIHDDVQEINLNDDDKFHNQQNQKQDAVNGTDQTIKLIGLEIHPIENSYDMDLHGIMYQQISAQILKMSIFEIQNENKENEKQMIFNLQGDTRSVTVAPIVGDGSCMFHSIVHQLNGTNTNEFIKIKTLSIELRAKIVAFITDNYETFKISLQGRVYDASRDEEIVDMKAECKQIIKKLSKYDYHGGGETLLAVALIFQVNIMIINEKGDYYFANKFDTSYKKTIILAYRLRNYKAKGNEPRNHYDSVVHIDSNDLYTMTQIIVSKMQNCKTVEIE